MLETAKSIITDALEDIVVLTSESPISANDAHIAIRALNRIMASLAANGMHLGYTEVTKIDDDITVPAGATDPMVALLAMRLWPKYRSIELPSSIIINARAALKTIAKISVSTITASFPPTLPIGSGNESTDFERFYPESLDSIFTETDGLISVEDNTNE